MPGLGTFSTCNEKAFYNPIDDMFYPSRIHINFSDSQDEEVQNLTGSLKRKLKVSEREAETMINGYVSFVKQKLKLSNYCKIESIGYLMKDKKGNIYLKDTFSQRGRFNLLTPKSIS